MANSSIKYTRSQELALMRDRHLVVTANAGSGKTSVLVRKYIDLLENSIKNKDKSKSAAFRSIVAITFTRQAAADMRAKIVDKLSKRLLDNKDLSSSELKAFKRLRESVSSARISTIHSFCNSLLREYPIEAGISPIFRELDDFEQSNITNYSVDFILEDYSERMLEAEDKNNLSDELKVYSSIIDSIGIGKLREYLLILISEPVSLNTLIDFYDRNTYEIVEVYKKNISDFYQSIINSYLEYYPQIRDLLNLNAEDNTKLEEFYSVLERTHPNNLDALITNIEEFSTLKIQNPASKRQKGFISYVKDVSEGEQGNSYLRNYYESCTNLIKVILETNKLKEFTSDFIEQAKLLIQLASEAKEKYDKEKDDLAAYSFDDLLIRTNQLLSNDEVRRKIIENIDYLLVDEFQDTNQIQYDIVKKLTPSLDNYKVEHSPKVFIVGDEKQSIYGFRSADVAVFREASLNIIDSNEATNDKVRQFPQLVEIRSGEVELSKEEADGEVGKGKLVLADTFRLLPGIAMFVNYTCRRIFSSLTNSDMEYEPFICGRERPEELNNGDTIGTKNGSVRFLITIREKVEENKQQSLEEPKNDAGENIESSAKFTYSPAKEEEQVINYIKQIVAGKTDITIKRGDKYVTPEYSDIAILSRKKAAFKQLVPLLISNNIPYAISSGTGFYSTQEILDFVSLLKLLINQNDDVSCAGVLKSPLFNLSDAELVAISQAEGKNFYEKFLSFTPDNSEMLSLVARSRKILQELINAAARLSITELIIMIIELTDYYGSIERFEAKEQIKANINQLIQNALDFESKGYKSLYDFIQRVEKLSETSKESEATFITGENLINIMTTHAAKGLEFPIVILFSTNGKNRVDSGLIKGKNLGLSFNYKIPKIIQNNMSILVEQNTIPKVLIKNINAQKDRAEEARLLYVAMTRAKDHLIISSTTTKNTKSYSIEKNSFADLLFKTALDFEQIIDNESTEINDKLEFTQSDNNDKILNLNMRLLKPEYNELLDITTKSEIESQELEKDEKNFMLSTEIAPSGKFDIVSATKLSKYSSDLDDFYANYVLGLPKIDDKAYSNHEFENILLNKENPDSINDSDSGAEAGTIIHKVLENINEWIFDALKGDYVSLDDRINKALFSNYEQDNTKLFERVKKECTSIAQSNLLKEYAEHLIHSEYEKMLYLPLNSSMLIGTIDLLIKSEDESIIEVWDWKSNVVESKEKFDILVEYYLPQLKFYLLFISKLYPNREKYKAKLLFTRLSYKSKEWYFPLEITQEELDKFEIELGEKMAEVNDY